MHGAIFTYHSQNCGGYDYSSNNHLAFADDLRLVREMNLPIISLREIAQKISTGHGAKLPEHFVAFSCDDGTSLDWQDYDHPQFGLQRSFANILRDHLSATNSEGQHLLTSFVIASPEARAAIDAGCYDGIPLSNDDWWPEAAREGLIAIENHSWDHVHAVLPDTLRQHGTSGDFSSVDDFDSADFQVSAAAEYIDQRLAGTGQRSQLFAYPYGHTNAFLTQEYFPGMQSAHNVIAAFTTEHQFVSDSSPVYELPRLVCGDAWHKPEEFQDILRKLIAQ